MCCSRYHPCLRSTLPNARATFIPSQAFVIGLLEIIAGELVTGVTRFIAVSVKTFVLCLGTRYVSILRESPGTPYLANMTCTFHILTSFGMMAVLTNVHDTWLAQSDNCQRLDVNNRSKDRLAQACFSTMRQPLHAPTSPAQAIVLIVTLTLAVGGESRFTCCAPLPVSVSTAFPSSTTGAV